MTTSLLAAASQIDDVAAELRARAALIALHAATTRWRSPSARLYFSRIEDLTAELTGCATQVADLADLARRHAVHS